MSSPSSSSSFSSSKPSSSPPANPVTITENRINESATCELCGRTGAAEFGDQKLCVDCYQGCGSCCCESESEPDPNA